MARRQRWPRCVGFALLSLVILISMMSALAPGLLPGGAVRRIAALGIFGTSMAALAAGGVPGLFADRADVALAGAALMVASGVLPLQAATQAIDLDTITLLLGMMIVVASLRVSGFFAVASAWIVARVKTPLGLLCAVTCISGFFSAFLVNDAVCLVLAPLVLEIALRLGRPPAPYLLATAMASNAGSVATITGNPQNMLIGSFSKIPYTSFALSLGPVAVFGILVTAGLIAVVYRRQFFGGGRLKAAPLNAPLNARLNAPVHRLLVARALAAVGLMVVLFFLGQAPAKAAMVIGGLLLLSGRVKSARIYAEIDGRLLLMFAGLFIIVSGAERALLTPEVLAQAARLHLAQVPVLSLVTAVLSNLISNVPAVLVLRPFIAPLPDHARAWLTVAMASTLAGNFTILGSVANLIVVQAAASRGVVISFWNYFRVGAPLALITLAAGTFRLWV